MVVSVKPVIASGRRTASAVRIRSHPRTLWRYFRNYPLIPIAILALFVFIAAFGPFIAPYERDIGELRDRHLRPFSTGFVPEGQVRPDHQVRAWWPASFYLLGTDHVGRDIFTRILSGARISMLIMLGALSTGIVAGTTLGIAAGWFRGLIDGIITRFVDIFMALPFVMVATVITLVFGRSITILILVLVLFSWVVFVRIVRAETLQLKNRDYIDSARVSGASQFWMIRKHIFPHVLPTLLVISSSAAAGLLTADAILNFLGIGFDRTIPTWGNLIEGGRNYMVIAPHQFAAPGVALLLVAVGSMFFGDWLRERLNPNLRAI